MFSRLKREIRDTIEDWAPILFAVGVALLLFATLEAQLARGLCV